MVSRQSGSDEATSSGTTDFISEYPRALSLNDCRRIVNLFHATPVTQGRVGSGVRPGIKNSEDIVLSSRTEFTDVQHLLQRTASQYLLEYVREHPYFILAPFHIDSGSGGLTPDDLRTLPSRELAKLVGTLFVPAVAQLQRYEDTVGHYQQWHSENSPSHGSITSLRRVLFWILYLNDGFRDGETDFYHQHRTVKPEAGKLVIAPTAFTHCHRGRAPRGKAKYIATSWVLFREKAPQLPRNPARHER